MLSRTRKGTITVATAVCLLATTIPAAHAASPDGPDSKQDKQVQTVKPSAEDKKVTEKAKAQQKQAKVAEKTDRVIVKFKDGVNTTDQKKVLDKVAKTTEVDKPEVVKKTVDEAVVFESEKDLNKQDQKKVVEKLESESTVEYAEPDQIVTTATAGITSSPNDPYFGYQWGMRDINANTAWGRYTGAGKTIGIVDTGITDHPDLNNKVVPGYDFVSDDYYARDGGGRDPYPWDEGDWGQGTTSNWHGTHVAGIAAASTNNGMGVTGVAPNARIEPLRALGNSGSGYVSDMADAVTWGSGGYVTGVGANKNKSDVINLSVSWPSDACPAVMKSAIDGAHARNVPVTVASGNIGADSNYQTPSNCLGAIVVGATAAGNVMTGYSNWGSMLDVLAPGGAVGSDIWSTVNAGAYGPTYASYGTLNGTSMAAPHVAGTIALMKEKNPSLSVEQIRGILVKSGVASSGYTKIDANRAVNATPAPPAPVAPKVNGFTLKGGIGAYYYNHGGAKTFGNPVTNEQKTAVGGYVQSFSKDNKITNIYWTSQYGSHSVALSKGIGSKFVQSGREKGYGMPINDESRSQSGGYYQVFVKPGTNKKTVVMWTQQTGAHSLEEWTAIGKEWVKNGREHTVGHPVTDEVRRSNGTAYQVFRNAKTGKKVTYEWSSKGGVRIVR